MANKITRNFAINAAFAAAHTHAALHNLQVDTNVNFHGVSAITCDSWPTIVAPANELFPDGYMIDILPDEAACEDEAIVPNGFLVQVCGMCGFCSDVEITLDTVDHDAVISTLRKALSDAVADVYSMATNA